jgi:hypothetical protein
LGFGGWGIHTSRCVVRVLGFTRDALGGACLIGGAAIVALPLTRFHQHVGAPRRRHLATGSTTSGSSTSITGHGANVRPCLLGFSVGVGGSGRRQMGHKGSCCRSGQFGGCRGLFVRRRPFPGNFQGIRFQTRGKCDGGRSTITTTVTSHTGGNGLHGRREFFRIQSILGGIITRGSIIACLPGAQDGIRHEGMLMSAKRPLGNGHHFILVPHNIMFERRKECLHGGGGRGHHTVRGQTVIA